MIMNGEVVRIWKVLVSMYYSSIHLELLWKTRKRPQLGYPVTQSRLKLSASVIHIWSVTIT
jgi:hypothetical protein